MTIFAAQQEADRRRAELDGLTRNAWAEYRLTSQELQGAAYDEAEAAAWEQLQSTLGDLERERAQLVSVP